MLEDSELITVRVFKIFLVLVQKYVSNNIGTVGNSLRNSSSASNLKVNIKWQLLLLSLSYSLFLVYMNMCSETCRTSLCGNT